MSYFMKTKFIIFGGLSLGKCGKYLGGGRRDMENGNNAHVATAVLGSHLRLSFLSDTDFFCFLLIDVSFLS